MKIQLKEITIKEVSEDYLNDEEGGVVGYKGKLNIRPKYQREFVYKDKQKDAVIETIRKNFPLNVMYWVKNENGTYEMMDGQQRTISFCEYIAGKFSLNYQYFHNLEETEKNQILNYKLMVYFCEGTDKEKLDLFKEFTIKKYSLDREILIVIKELQELLEFRKKSPVEFVKKDNYIVCSSRFNTKTINIQKIKYYVQDIKILMEKTNRILKNGL